MSLDDINWNEAGFALCPIPGKPGRFYYKNTKDEYDGRIFTKAAAAWFVKSDQEKLMRRLEAHNSHHKSLFDAWLTVKGRQYGNPLQKFDRVVGCEESDLTCDQSAWRISGEAALDRHLVYGLTAVSAEQLLRAAPALKGIRFPVLGFSAEDPMHEANLHISERDLHDLHELVSLIELGEIFPRGKTDLSQVWLLLAVRPGSPPFDDRQTDLCLLGGAVAEPDRELFEQCGGPVFSTLSRHLWESCSVGGLAPGEPTGAMPPLFHEWKFKFGLTSAYHLQGSIILVTFKSLKAIDDILLR